MRAFQDAVRRRAVEREPVAYIVGRAAFAGSSWPSIAARSIPRPETELLVEVGARRCRAARACSTCGTGSGAVALALKDERPDLRVTGSDLSEDALALARANGERLGLEVEWLHADLLAGVPDEFDAILSNPPYVAESDARVAGARDPPPRAARGAVRRAGRAGRDPRAARPGAPRARGCGRWRWRSAPGRPARSCELMRRGGLRRGARRARPGGDRARRRGRSASMSDARRER